jgi:hypothetical protein
MVNTLIRVWKPRRLEKLVRFSDTPEALQPYPRMRPSSVVEWVNAIRDITGKG